MADARVANALEARRSLDSVARAIVVTGDDPSSRYWSTVFGDRRPADASNAGSVIAEAGRKGNFLGALQAYRRATRGELSPSGIDGVDQLVMLVGAGTRLSPITQSLRNMKAALVLPSDDAGRSVLTVGEAAVRSGAPCVRALHDGGFSGMVLRWGDEVVIPSTTLATGPGRYAEVDAVRFGYRVAPTELLASQKEWLVCDLDDQVRAELPRQSLGRLESRLSELGSDLSVYVNLGSFAASHQLLEAMTEAFDDLLGADGTAVNWDPYLWMAFHSRDEQEWERECLAGAASRPSSFASLLASVPDVWSRVRGARGALETHLQRPLRVEVLDFGDPYWFDAGNHASLRAGLRDIFEPGPDGETVRAFLGLPEGLAGGESFVSGSAVATGASVSGSVVIGSKITDSASSIGGGIVVNSRLGDATVRAGGVVIECDCDHLSVDGPAGLAFRISGDARVGGNEVTADVGLPPELTRLSYLGADTIVDDDAYRTRLGANPVSFEEAAAMAELVDPLELRDHWAAVALRRSPGT